jgi:hypothetical protein
MLMGSLAIVGLGGCENLPGSRETQSTVIGGAAGAATGALIGGEDNRLVGALIGGALGAGGGYLIGARTDWFGEDDASDEAMAAIEEARQSPATAADVAAADTADLNRDGFVTMDEVTAMADAGLSDSEMLARLRATGQVFDLSAAQAEQLRSRGVSAYVVNEMQKINQEQKERVLSNSEVLGR